MFFKRFNNSGNILLSALVFGSIAMTILVSVVSGYAVSENRASVRKHNRELAFQIADAGINYYRWHLAHDKEDYQDGTGEDGIYLHEYYDKDNNLIGYYSLNITPPSSGSTVVTIESTGWTIEQPESDRILKARVGFPALTDYAFLTDADAWIGDSEVTHGKFHANGGIRYDGVGDAPITSAVLTYTCQEHHGCGGGQAKPGIWGDGTSNLWNFDVPAEDFDAVTVKLSEIEQNAGLSFSSSGKQGWFFDFQSDGTINVQKVNSTNCYKGQDVNDNKKYWFCLDIRSLGSVINYPMPANGYIYVEDTVWVEGTVNGRATIGTGEDESIILNDDIIYQEKNGEHVLGLIASENILIPHDSPNDLEIDAAILAQNGAAKRYYYSGNTKDNLSIYGSVITAGAWTWSWVSGGGSVVSGYKNTTSNYDVNLTYNPPPGFPVGSEYNLITWEEVK